VQGASDAGPDPDVPAGLPARSSREDLRGTFEQPWGQALDPERGPHRGRDHGRGLRWRDPRHVRRWARTRRCRDPDLAPCPRGAGQARPPRGAGPLPDRDRLPCRRRAAGLGLRRKGRQLHQHRPPRAARPPGRSAARPGPAGLVDHPGNRPPHGAATGPTPARPTCSPKWPPSCPPWRTSPGTASNATAPSPTPPKPRRTPSHDIIFTDGFPTEDHRARIVPADVLPPDELPDADSPLVLSTGASSNTGTPAR
jgi:hypothetical protein